MCDSHRHCEQRLDRHPKLGAQVSRDGLHRYRVRSRDASVPAATSAWSVYGSFTVITYVEPGGSCPFLFTFDGTGYRFEADNFTAARLGGPTSSGYQQPNPNDAYILKTVPVQADGSLQFRLVEERHEVDYLDSYKLYCYRRPVGTQVFAEKAVAGKRTFPALDICAPYSARSAPAAVRRSHRHRAGRARRGVRSRRSVRGSERGLRERPSTTRR